MVHGDYTIIRILKNTSHTNRNIIVIRRNPSVTRHAFEKEKEKLQQKDVLERYYNL